MVYMHRRRSTGRCYREPCQHCQAKHWFDGSHGGRLRLLLLLRMYASLSSKEAALPPTRHPFHGAIPSSTHRLESGSPVGVYITKCSIQNAVAPRRGNAQTRGNSDMGQRIIIAMRPTAPPSQQAMMPYRPRLYAAMPSLPPRRRTGNRRLIRHWIAGDWPLGWGLGLLSKTSHPCLTAQQPWSLAMLKPSRSGRPRILRWVCWMMACPPSSM